MTERFLAAAVLQHLDFLDDAPLRCSCREGIEEFYPEEDPLDPSRGLLISTLAGVLLWVLIL